MITFPKILLVENNLINIKVATLLLKSLGCKKIIVTETGRDAIAAFTPDIDLVLLDIGLPDIDGVTVCEQMRQKPTNKTVPIIAWTAFDEPDDDSWVKAGITGYLPKPVTKAGFAKMLKDYCGV